MVYIVSGATLGSSEACMTSSTKPTAEKYTAAAKVHPALRTSARSCMSQQRVLVVLIGLVQRAGLMGSNFKLTKEANLSSCGGPILQTATADAGSPFTVRLAENWF